jgi:general secretion pathway protein H
VTRNGFTLVELMVVIAVMGLLAGVVVMTAGMPGGGPADSATRFAGRLAAARDQAIVTGQPISAWVTSSGYGFARFHRGHWEAMAEKPFDGGDWKEGTSVAIESESGRLRVRFDSLGMADRPVVLRLSRDDRTAVVRIAANGDIAVD